MLRYERVEIQGGGYFIAAQEELTDEDISRCVRYYGVIGRAASTEIVMTIRARFLAELPTASRA